MERTNGWEIFKVRGVGVRLHVSLLFLLFYIFLVSTLQFPYIVQSSGIDAQYVSQRPTFWGAIFAFSVVASVFLHELSHVIVAQLKGAKVRRITLMMLGGVSEMSDLPEKPLNELKVAIIGPLVSLAIGAGLYTLSNSVDNANVSFFCYWVGNLNIGLGIFNLLPAFPTDGGRVLRSLFEARVGKMRGTQMAVNVSNVFSLMFAIWGVLQFNLLLLLIAFFIYSSAKAELFYLTAEHALKGLKVSDLVVESPIVYDDQMISDAADVMFNTHVTSIPIKRGPSSYAILDAATIERIPSVYWDQIPISKAETPVQKTVDVEEPLENALKAVLSSGASGIPVTDHDQLKGIIRMSDLMNAIQLRRLTLSRKAG